MPVCKYDMSTHTYTQIYIRTYIYIYVYVYLNILSPSEKRILQQ